MYDIPYIHINNNNDTDDDDDANNNTNNNYIAAPRSGEEARSCGPGGPTCATRIIVCYVISVLYHMVL